MNTKNMKKKITYEAIYTLTSEDRWLVTFPSFPNLRTDGATLEEARNEAKDALLSELEISRKLRVNLPQSLKSYIELVEIEFEVEEKRRKKKEKNN